MITTVISHAAGDVFPASDWNTYIRDNLNWLIQSGGAIASANDLNVTNEFHIVTGTTQLQTITYSGVVQGQQLRILAQSAGLGLSNSAGNIRTASGMDRVLLANEVITLVYDGTNWREQGGTKQLLAFGFKTSDVTSTATTFAAGADVLASALSFTSDGVSAYLLRVEASAAYSNTSGDQVVCNLNLDGADGGIMATQVSTQTGSPAIPVSWAGKCAPAAGTHTINARIRSTSGNTARLSGGAGGAGVAVPITVTLWRYA